MIVAVIKDNVCVNTVVFEDLKTAQEFLDGGVWPEADSVEELPDGYGIGDKIIDGEWVKDELEIIEPEPEPEPEPNLEPTAKDILLAFNGGLL